MQKWWELIKHFTPQEVGELMDCRFMFKLDNIRKEWGEPLHINSGYRTEEHNAKVGGVVNSPHRHGRAVDIDSNGWNSSKRERFAKLCKAYGMTGFGDGVTFIHVDDCDGLTGHPRPRRWEYKGHTIVNSRVWI